MPIPAAKPPAAQPPAVKPKTAAASGMGGKALLGVVGLAVGFVAGYGAGRVSTGTPINPLTGRGGSYEEGYADAMRKVAESGLLPPSPTESTMISGTVKDVSGNRLTIEADLQAFDPLGLKGLPKERTVTVSASTKITSISEMSPEEAVAAQLAYEQALAAYEPGPENLDPPPVPPSGFKEAAIALTDLKAGDRVTVTAAADILASASFEAVSILRQPAPSSLPTTAPAPPPSAP